MLNNLILLSSMALAEGPKFSILAEQEPAPFEGVLFDPQATAVIMSEKEMWQRTCDLEIEFQLDQQGTKFNLDIQNAQIRYDSLKEETDLLIEKKDLEIYALKETLRKQSPSNNWLWFAGGTATGVVATVAIINVATKLVASDK